MEFKGGGRLKRETVSGKVETEVCESGGGMKRL